MTLTTNRVHLDKDMDTVTLNVHNKETDINIELKEGYADHVRESVLTLRDDHLIIVGTEFVDEFKEIVRDVIDGNEKIRIHREVMLGQCVSIVMRFTDEGDATFKDFLDNWEAEIELPTVQPAPTMNFIELVQKLMSVQSNHDLVDLGFTFGEWIYTRFEMVGHRWYIESDQQGNLIVVEDIGNTHCQVLGLIDAKGNVFTDFQGGEPSMIKTYLEFYHHDFIAK